MWASLIMSDAMSLEGSESGTPEFTAEPSVNVVGPVKYSLNSLSKPEPTRDFSLLPSGWVGSGSRNWLYVLITQHCAARTCELIRLSAAAALCA